MAAVMLLGATVLLLRGVAGGKRAGAYHAGFIVAAVLGIAVVRAQATERRWACCWHFLPGQCWRRVVRR
jgi:hypothetical protein